MAETEHHVPHVTVFSHSEDRIDWVTVDRKLILMSLWIARRSLRLYSESWSDETRVEVLDRLGFLIREYKRNEHDEGDEDS